MSGRARAFKLSGHPLHILMKILGLLAAAFVAASVLIRLGDFEMAKLKGMGVVILSLDILCLVLGVFLYAGIAALQSRSGWFLLLFFLSHLLLAADAMLWIFDGDVRYIATHNLTLAGLYFFDLLSVPIFIILVRQVTSGGFSLKELIRTDSVWDMIGLVVTGACFLLALMIWAHDIQNNSVYYIDADGYSRTGKYHVLYSIIVTIPKLFCLARIFRSEIRVFKRVTLLFYVIVPILFAVFGPEKGGDDITYPLIFVVLLVTFGQFFSELGLKNEKMKNVLGTYVSEDVVNYMLERENSQEGKNYTATVLLTDLRGFTSASAHLTTEDTVTILNHWLAEMSEVVRDLNGSMTEFLGDGFLAVFGAPTEMKDHADRAVAAALLMQKKTEEASCWNREHGYPPIRMGIGLSSGELLFGSFGTARIARLMAIGEPVNRAFEAEEKTLGGQILITPETMEMLSCPVKASMIENIRGMKAYSVTGLGAPWDLALETEEEPVTELKKPVSVRLRRLEGKNTVEEEFRGTLIAVSCRKAVIRPEQPMRAYEQIRFNMETGVKETIYARVGGEDVRSGEVFTADITVCPRGLEEFCIR